MYYFIVNPGSRSGNGRKVWETVEQLLEAQSIEYRVFFTSYRYHAARLSAEITSRRERLTLIAVGGDGTVNEVINGIQDFSRVTFGYIPTGSSNDFARGLSLPVSPEEAVENILRPSCYRRLDLGCISYDGRKRYFVDGCGCGFDAAVCQEALSSPIKDLLNQIHLGKLTYVGIALKQILLFRPFPTALILDQTRKLSYKRTYFIASMNCRYEGGGLKLCPKAQENDGLLDVCVVEGLSKLTIALMFPTAFWGKHTIFKGIHIYRAQDIEIRCGGQAPVHTDGETSYASGSIKISCLPKKLTIISGN